MKILQSAGNNRLRKRPLFSHGKGGIFKCQQKASKGRIRLEISNGGGGGENRDWIRTLSRGNFWLFNEKGCGKESSCVGFMVRR